MTEFQKPRNTRRESRTLAGKIRAGKLVPVMAVPVRPSEGGMISQRVQMELEPVAGRLRTPVTGEFISVFVPVQAMDAILDPEAAYAGMTEVVRTKLLSGNPLFGMEPQSEVSRLCGVNPRQIGGSRQVCSVTRLAHNCAVNYLRQRRHRDAQLLPHTYSGITPAIVSQTVLDRFNGVLDPDDRINGSVSLELPQMKLPVENLAFNAIGSTFDNVNQLRTSTGTASHAAGNVWRAATVQTALNSTNQSDLPLVWARLNGGRTGGVSLTDFYNAQEMDRRVREMRAIADENPEYGDEMILRWAHGLSVDPGRHPFIIAEREMIFGRDIIQASDSDGVLNETLRSDMALSMSFAVPIPRTELGGMIITFITFKPDETIPMQPHPILSEPWGVDNFLADELALDPVPVTVRDLFSEPQTTVENNVQFYTGLNALKQNYEHYGFNGFTDLNSVDSRTQIWQLNLPLSVTPTSILYPDNIPQYPFADHNANNCTYVVESMATIATPMVFGPSPVETLAIIDDVDLFDEEE